MSGRKPPGTSWESWVDQLIREGRERGEFDDLTGTGKPIAGLDRPYDEMWWVRKKLQSEGVSYLPPTLAIRKEKEETLEHLPSERSENRVRQLLEDLNSRIREINRRPGEGPPSTVMPVDIETAVEQWRAVRAAKAEATSSATARATSPTPALQPGRRRWRKRNV